MDKNAYFRLPSSDCTQSIGVISMTQIEINRKAKQTPFTHHFNTSNPYQFYAVLSASLTPFVKLISINCDTHIMFTYDESFTMPPYEVESGTKACACKLIRIAFRSYATKRNSYARAFGKYFRCAPHAKIFGV